MALSIVGLDQCGVSKRESSVANYKCIMPLDYVMDCGVNLAIDIVTLDLEHQINDSLRSPGLSTS